MRADTQRRRVALFCRRSNQPVRRKEERYPTRRSEALREVHQLFKARETFSSHAFKDNAASFVLFHSVESTAPFVRRANSWNIFDARKRTVNISSRKVLHFVRQHD